MWDFVKKLSQPDKKNLFVIKLFRFNFLRFDGGKYSFKKSFEKRPSQKNQIVCPKKIILALKNT